MLIAAILMMTLSLPGFAQPEPEEEETGQFKRGIKRTTDRKLQKTAPQIRTTPQIKTIPQAKSKTQRKTSLYQQKKLPEGLVRSGKRITVKRGYKLQRLSTTRFRILKDMGVMACTCLGSGSCTGGGSSLCTSSSNDPCSDVCGASIVSRPGTLTQ
jgi:hypothetical protein